MQHLIVELFEQTGHGTQWLKLKLGLCNEWVFFILVPTLLFGIEVINHFSYLNKFKYGVILCSSSLIENRYETKMFYHEQTHL